MIVLDASVIIKWFIQEEGTAKALHFKTRLIEGKENIVVPDLLVYEIVNVLRFKKNIPQGEITAIIPDLFNVGLQITIPSPNLLQDALYLSLLTGLSVYDAAYLALTSKLEATLITADRSIVRQAHPFVQTRLLEDT